MAHQIMGPKGEPIAATLLDWYNSQLHSKCYPYPTDKQLSLTSRKLLLQLMGTITATTTGQNGLCGAQPQLINLQHNPYSEGSGNITKEGLQRLEEPEDEEVCRETLSSIHV